MSILIDTGIFYAFYNKRDIHHLDSICILVHAMEGKWGRIYTTNLIVAEAATLLRYRIGLKATMGFLEALNGSNMKIIFIDELLYDKTIKTLVKHPNKRLSFADAFSIITISKLGINYLATYDERSFKGLINNIIGNEYSKILPKEEIDRILKEINYK